MLVHTGTVRFASEPIPCAFKFECIPRGSMIDCIPTRQGQPRFDWESVQELGTTWYTKPLCRTDVPPFTPQMTQYLASFIVQSFVVTFGNSCPGRLNRLGFRFLLAALGVQNRMQRVPEVVPVCPTFALLSFRHVGPELLELLRAVLREIQTYNPILDNSDCRTRTSKGSRSVYLTLIWTKTNSAKHRQGIPIGTYNSPISDGEGSANMYVQRRDEAVLAPVNDQRTEATRTEGGCQCVFDSRAVLVSVKSARRDSDSADGLDQTGHHRVL